MSKNRFAGINAAKRVADGAAQSEATTETHVSTAASQNKRGRPPGKRSNAEFRQLTIFVRGETLDRVKIALIREKGEVSELVESLLQEWLEKRDS